MHYQQLYHLLQSKFNSGGGLVKEVNVRIKQFNFLSAGYRVLPGKEQYYCCVHEKLFKEQPEPANCYQDHPLKIKDTKIKENKDFPYFVIYPEGKSSCNGVILLFHGLNEKKWDKYLPWGAELVNKTGKAVILMPIAFHMDRASKSWSSLKEMNAVAKMRQEKHPGYSNISFINTAVSIRLANRPERLFWSGLQTYLDVISLVKRIKKGQFEGVDKDASVDFFGYSIGAFLSLIILMANPRNYFDQTRLFAFCGGATLDRTFPISKYILDSHAGQVLNSYFSEQLHNNFRTNPRLAHYMNKHEGENFFKLLLHYNHYKRERENQIRKISNKILAVPLMKDCIAPPVEVLTTLKGDFRDIPTRVEPMDFDYPYDHVHPFSLMDKYKNQTDLAFQAVINKAADFLR